MKHCSFVSSLFLSCVMCLVGLLFAADSLFAADTSSDAELKALSITTNRCDAIVSQYSNEHDDIIQQKLRAAYKDDACFEQEKNTHGKPLSDAIVGPITKTWINQYMMDHTEKDCALDNQACSDEEINRQNASKVNREATNNRLYTSENGIAPYVLTSDDLTYFEINVDVYAAIKAMQSQVFITDTALLAAVKSDLSSIKGMSDALLKAYVGQVRIYITPVNIRILTPDTIDELIVNNYILAASSLQSQVNRPVNEKNFNKLMKNILRSAYLEENKQTKKDAVSDKPGKVVAKNNSSKNTEDGKNKASEDKAPNKKIVRKKPVKPLKLSWKQKREISKILEVIDATSSGNLQYNLDINEEVKKKFPSINDEIIKCVRNISNTGYYSRFAMKDSLKDMLGKIKKIQNGGVIPGFNCKIPQKTVDLKKSSDESAELKKTDENYDKAMLELLLNKSGKAFYGSNLEPIELLPFESCNECSLPMKGVNYGFYPFWQASAAYREAGLAVINPAEVDFSVFNRMAYFALPVSSDGSIESLLHWEDTSNIKSFVRTLNKFDVKRDLVLYSNSWQLWGAGKGEYDVKQLVQGYAEKHLSQIQRLHKRVESEGGLSGITLYFDGYKNDSDATNIVNYITHLKEQIIKARKAGTGEAFDINMVLGIRWNYQSEEYCRVGNIYNKNDTYFKEFEYLLVNDAETRPVSSGAGKAINKMESKIKNKLKGVPSDAEEPALMNLLVFLHEPSSRAKKCLRLQIENEFHGGRRIDILRKVIPILGRAYLKESDNKFKQFADDINYLKDNFGGIGMWPLPLSGVEEDAQDSKEAKNERAISRSVISKMGELVEEKYSEPYKNYMDYEKLGVIGGMLRRPEIADYFSVCSYMCPERSIFRYLLFLLIAGSIVSFVAFRVNCKAKRYIIKMKWIDISLKGTTFIVLLSILGCDPFWQPMSNTVLMISLASGIAYFFYRMFFCGYESESDE